MWLLPPARVKNKRKRKDVPLSTQCLQIINTIPVIGDSDFIFSRGPWAACAFPRGEAGARRAHEAGCGRGFCTIFGADLHPVRHGSALRCQ